MIVVKGNIATSEGNVSVEELEAGMEIIGLEEIPRKLISKSKKTAAGTLSFEKSGAVLSRDAVLVTAYGKRSFIPVKGIKQIKGLGFKMLLPTSKEVADTAVVSGKKSDGWELEIEHGKEIYVDGYCVML